MIQNVHANLDFGTFLGDWRKKRRYSQLSFGLFADVSPRHISFLETGRAKPSRDMVLKLTNHLNMPKVEINKALHLAGFSPAFLARSSDNIDLVPIRRAVALLLDNHMPYPAIGVDHLWNIKFFNPAAVKLLKDVGLDGYTNILEALCGQTPAQSAIENWDEAIGLLLEQLHAELLHRGYDPALQDLVQKLSDHYNRHSQNWHIDKSKAVIPTQFKIGELTISLFSTIVNFSTVQDVALNDLRIELMFPMDEASQVYFS